jgi:hypothetical protein
LTKQQFEVLGPGAPVGTARDSPDHDPKLIPRDWAIYLLHAAAEIEHALLVQYLYAAMTVNPDGAPTQALKGKVAGWQDTLLGIAKEEMGHLISVQNLLVMLGGPIHYERETFPIPSEFYPFGFELEPLTKESLAKYVLAEMPENPNPPLSGDLLERARITTDGQNINRVGALYARLYCIFSKGTEAGLWVGCAGFPAGDHLGDDNFAKNFTSYLADQGTWFTMPTGAVNPADFRILVPPVTNRDEAREAVKEIGEQGEGIQTPASGGELSHFQRFRAIYEDPDFPETDPELGSIVWRASHRVPRNPNTRTGSKRDESSIGHPRSRKWAQLFNFRYRLLLAYLAHYSQVDERDPDQSGRRGVLHNLAIKEMRLLMRVSSKLVTLPLLDDGDSRRAGPPFELPYTLDLPIREADRWRRHLDVLDDADALVNLIKTTHPEDANDPILNSLLNADLGPPPARKEGTRKQLLGQIDKPIQASAPAGVAGKGSGTNTGGSDTRGTNTGGMNMGGTNTGGTNTGGTPNATGGGGTPPKGIAPGSVHWPRVKEILDGAIADWTTKNHRPPLLKQRHGPSFSWDTKDQITNAVAQIGGSTFRLIDPSLVGNGKGRQTNLIIALTDPDGVEGNGQMPNNGPFLTDTHPTFIDEIVRWIDDGMPD